MEAGPSRRDTSSSWLPWSSSPSEPEVAGETSHSEASVSPSISDTGSDIDTETKPPPTRYDLRLPSSILAIAPTAAAVGLFIGMRRGGEKARLRFLAENAHRQPTTVQGWYFYTKTRNYRVLYGAVKQGGKTALALGSAGALFAAGEEGAGWLRERTFGVDLEGTPPDPRRVGWRSGSVHWEDGALAGVVMALGVGLLYRLPNPLMMRSLGMGFGLGGLTSALTIGSDKLVVKKAEEDRIEAERKANLPEGYEEEKGFDWSWGWIWRIFK